MNVHARNLIKQNTVGVILISFLLGVAVAEPLALPPEALRHAADYTFGYYPDGWRLKEGSGPAGFAVQTGDYALTFDAARARFPQLGPILEPLDADRAAGQGNELLDALPRVDLRCAVLADGRLFPAVAGAGNPSQLCLQRVGRYLQHFSIPAMQLGGLDSGAGLEGMNASMETFCWNGRMAIRMHLSCPESHLGPDLGRHEAVPAMTCNVPEAYPILEVLGDDGAWSPAEPGAASSRALLMRNESGAGIAFLAIPGAGGHVVRADSGAIRIEGAPFAPAPGTTRSFTGVLVPSRNVRIDALSEVAQMEASAAAALELEAEGMAPYTGPVPVRYDAAPGWYEIRLGENQDKDVAERVRVHVRNAGDAPLPVRLDFAKVGGGFPITGMSPVLRDVDGFPLGLPVQISKNWHCAPPWFTGLVVLEAPPGDFAFEFTLAYARWGGVPAVSHAQLCLFGYGGNQLWDQMAIGSYGESICYDPDVNLGRALVDDMRPLLVWGMGKTPRTQWSWTHNVGGCDFLSLYLEDQPKRQYLGRQKTCYAAQGPVITDVTYAGETPGGAIQSRVRTQSWRSDDYVRALYTLRYDVVKPVDGIDRIAFFQLGADHYNTVWFARMARGSAAGCDESWEPDRGRRRYSRRGLELAGAMPWVGQFGFEKRPESMYEADDQGVLGARAMIVRSWDARLNGQACPVPLYSVYGTDDGVPSALAELAPPPELDRLVPGDYVEAQVEVLILPQCAADYYGPNEGLRAALAAQAEPWALVLREAAGTQMEVQAAAGVVESAWPIRVRAEGGRRADFTIRGGVGYTPVSIVGAAAPRGFTLKTQAGGAVLEIVDQATALGNDWWQAAYDPAAGAWNLDFTLPLDPSGPGGPDELGRRFVWSLD